MTTQEKIREQVALAREYGFPDVYLTIPILEAEELLHDAEGDETNIKASSREPGDVPVKPSQEDWGSTIGYFQV